ncbi:MAG TPA: hypothetical protein VJ398_09085 [Acidimicrobiia bacterium]|nr:hypothetical protein [Acidimicrobiia bacterium]
MKFRAGMVVGLAAGYVLGTKAGRKRYEQIRRATSKASTHPAVRQVADQATALVDLGRSAIAEGLTVGSRSLRKAARSG